MSKRKLHLRIDMIKSNTYSTKSLDSGYFVARPYSTPTKIPCLEPSASPTNTLKKYLEP